MQDHQGTFSSKNMTFHRKFPRYLSLFEGTHTVFKKLVNIMNQRLIGPYILEIDSVVKPIEFTWKKDGTSGYKSPRLSSIFQHVLLFTDKRKVGFFVMPCLLQILKINSSGNKNMQYLDINIECLLSKTHKIF